MSKRRSTVIGDDDPGTPAEPHTAPPPEANHDDAPTQQFEAPPHH